MAVATICACIPTFRPIFTKHIPDAHTDYIHRDFTVNVSSGRPPAGMALFERGATCKVWAGKKMPIHSNELDERPFVKLGGQEDASM